MPRIHFSTLSARPEGFVEIVLPRPTSAPAGYTPVMLVTEWLTLNCIADWACRSQHRTLRVRFARDEDRARAAARFLEHRDVVSTLLDTGRAGPRRRSSARTPGAAAA